jgi:hypothetical protein
MKPNALVRRNTNGNPVLSAFYVVLRFPFRNLAISITIPIMLGLAAQFGWGYEAVLDIINSALYLLSDMTFFFCFLLLLWLIIVAIQKCFQLDAYVPTPIDNTAELYKEFHEQEARKRRIYFASAEEVRYMREQIVESERNWRARAEIVSDEIEKIQEGPSVIQRRVRRVEGILNFVARWLPQRINNEDVGDAIERLRSGIEHHHSIVRTYVDTGLAVIRILRNTAQYVLSKKVAKWRGP